MLKKERIADNDDPFIFSYIAMGVCMFTSIKTQQTVSSNEDVSTYPISSGVRT